MAEKEILLLKRQIERLDEPKFDLEAWKNHTLIFLERIFGKENQKIKMIKELAYDYSSWSLRDTAAAGKTKDKDPVRLQAQEILNATIEELEMLGLPKNKSSEQKVWELLNDELTGKQTREIKEIMQSESNDKVAKIQSLLELLNKENLANIIAKLLTD